MTRAPRVVYTPDNRTSGCPPAAAANTDLWAQAFTISGSSADVMVMVDTITDYIARVDTYLVVDGTTVRHTLTDSSSSSWKPVHIIWGGTLTTGSHTISIRSTVANTLGCGPTWGSITTTIYE